MYKHRKLIYIILSTPQHGDAFRLSQTNVVGKWQMPIQRVLSKQHALGESKAEKDGGRGGVETHTVI